MTILLLVIFGVLILGFIVVYNMLVARKHRIDEAWSDIEVQLKRRYDLIPNVVETVKGYAQHERSLFENVTRARTEAMGATSTKDHSTAENMLTGALKSLFAVAENYPDLKTNVNFLELQRELADTENKIQAARRFYNGVVLEYNVSVDQFPSNIVARLFRFMKREFFDLEEEAAEKPVAVKF